MADGGIYEYRSFYARRGQRVTVTQRSSEFDSYLSVGQLNNEVYREIASDDDSGGGTSAQNDSPRRELAGSSGVATRLW